MDLNHSNMENDSNHNLRKSMVEGFRKTSPEKIIKLDDGGEFIIQEIKTWQKSDKIRDS